MRNRNDENEMKDAVEVEDREVQRARRWCAPTTAAVRHDTALTDGALAEAPDTATIAGRRDGIVVLERARAHERAHAALVAQ